MKKFDDLMSVGSEIENISASDAKKKLITLSDIDWKT